MAGLVAAWFNVAVGIGIPLAALVLLFIKKRSYVKWFLLGVLGFLVSQVLTRLPLLGILQGTYGYYVFNANHPYITLFLLSVSAAVFEESARYSILYLCRRHALNSGAAISYGLGHGGFEAFFTGFNSLLLIFGNETIFAGWTLAYGGIERLSAMMAHIAFTIVVYLGVVGKKRMYYLWAIALHTLYNFSLIFLYWGMPPLVLELLLLMASTGLLFVSLYRLKRRKEK